jgi:CzcA family heavy metal efflux pump
MIRWIIASSLRFRFLVMAVAAAMVFFGMRQLRDMPVDVFPEFAPPLVEIQTEGPGMTAAEVEELITTPMEEFLRGTPELQYMRSKSVVALSAIRLIFKPGTDILRARQLVQERLELAISSLPKSAGMPVILQPLSATSRVMKIGLTSKVYDMKELSMTAYWKIRFRLLGVPGVANVPIWGERIKLLAVQVDPDRLVKHRVTLNEVEQATSNALEVGLLPYTAAAKTRTEGFIDTPNQRLTIRHVQPVIGPEELANVPITVSGGRTLRIGDVADVVWDTWPMVGDAVINDGEGLMMIVEKLPWANTLEVTRGVEAALKEMAPGLPGIDIDHKIFRPATFIEMSIGNLTNAMIIGAVLMIAMLALFLYEWRVALTSVVAIPLSLMAAGLVLYMRGATINVMILAGLVIALGDIVDDAIIGIENIVRRLRESRKAGASPQTSFARLVLGASLEVRSAIVYATLIEVVAVVPVFFMEGLSGAFFRPLVLSYALALLASMIVALTVTPAMAFLLLRNASLESRESPVVPWLQRAYVALLARIIPVPARAYAAVGAMMLVGVVGWSQLGQSLLPDFKERDFLMHWLAKPGTSHPEMYRITAQASKELRAIPGVQNFGAHIGRAVVADEVVGMYFAENWVSVDPKADYDGTLQKIQEAVDGYPGIYRDVQTYLKERIREVLTGGKQAVIVRLYGNNLDTLHQQASKVVKALDGIPGLVDLHAELHENVPQVEVRVDLAKAEGHGLKPGDIRRAAATMMAGIEVSDIHKDGKVYDVQVWSVPKVRHSLTSIENVLIDAPRGGHVRLGDVARVRIAPTPNVIEHEGLARRQDVGANVRGRDLAAVAKDVQARLAKVEFPLGYYAEMLGEYQERQKAQKNVTTVSLLALVGIFLLLQLSFGSWKMATLSFLTLPTALVGGVLAIYMTDRTVSLGALVGFLAVLGIAARNGIMMIDHFQHLEREEGEPFGPNLVLRGARERISPIMMTALTTGLALAPLVVAGSIPGHEIEHPLAVVVLGGLITSTLVNLFVVPSLYLRFGGGRMRVAPSPQGA